LPFRSFSNIIYDKKSHETIENALKTVVNAHETVENA
jgi:hypothetical protein